jgi:hypothetical protein
VAARDLQDVFGAGPRPAQWLASFEANKLVIRGTARSRYRQTGACILVLRRVDLEAHRDAVQQH